MTPEVADEIRQLDALDREIERGIAGALETAIPTITLGDLGPASPAQFRYAFDDGTKFPGGFGDTQILLTDYWTLRARSIQLFETNLYARGLIRRFVTNVINTGLHLECIPEESILGFAEDELSDWSELVENRFGIWTRTAWLCDQRELSAFGALQASSYAEALIAGDVLVVLRQDPRTGLPRVQLISGSAIQSPLEAGALGRLANGNRVCHGVELDRQGRHVAFWVREPDPQGIGTVGKRLPAWGEKSGRRLAWLVYATDKRLDDVRGKPILSLMLQSVREIDRYRDSVQRKAVINSMLAMFIEKGEEKMGTMPITGGAIRRGTLQTQDIGGAPRTFRVAEHIPGLVLDELQHGEVPRAFPSNGTDEKFGDFEAAIVHTLAWATETPPEILRLTFGNNYAASQAAINEYKMFLNRVRAAFGDEFCAPIYQEWLISEVLSQRIQADGLIEAWRDLTQYDVFCAWVASEWAGQIKPAVDLSKLVKGYKEMVAEGFITRDRASRELTGTKFSKNAKRLRIENEQLKEANAALAPPPAEPKAPRSVDDSEERDEERGESEQDDDADARAEVIHIHPKRRPREDV